MKQWDTVAIVGVGLIGGSIGLALRQRNLAKNVVGIGRRQASLRVARRIGAITHTTIDLNKGVAEAELVDRLHAGRPDRRARPPGRPALPRAGAADRRRQRRSRRSSRPSTAGWPAAAGFSAAIPWPAARRPARPTPRPTCSRAGWPFSRPRRTRGPKTSICSKSSGSRSARWSCR